MHNIQDICVRVTEEEMMAIGRKQAHVDMGSGGGGGRVLYHNAHVSPPVRHKKEKKKDKERERRGDKERLREDRERSASKKKKSKDKEREREREQRERKSDGEKGDVKVGV